MVSNPLEQLAGVLPKDLRQLLAFVPTRGWDALEWRPLLKQLRGITWQLTTTRGVKELADSLEGAVTGLSLENNQGSPLSSLSKTEKKRAGDTILRLYFTQFQNPRGLFLDLRTARFEVCAEELRFKGSGLHATLAAEFRLGMVKLYRGFYEHDAELLDEALYEMGFLHEELTDEDADELRGLLQSHFGSQERTQKFSIDTFKKSFDALFDFFIEHGYTLRRDFVLVGFYLITLYLVLEDLGQSHNVQRICQETLGR